MPDDKAAGILVDPMGPAEALSQEEHKLLRLSLDIYRASDDRGEAFWTQIYHLLYQFEHQPETVTEAQVMQSWVISFLQDQESSFTGNRDHADGLLAGFDDEQFFMLNDEELRILVNTHKALQVGGWFAEWLSLQVACIAKAQRPEEKAPSPLFIAGTLTEAINEWNQCVETAKKFADRRPDLLFPTLPAEPEAAPEPVAATTPAKAPRARKARKKAA